jgi:nitrogen fixation protein NifU and related proteins
MSGKLDDMYRDIIMEHYRFPRGSKKISHADLVNEGKNPACGDEIEIKVEMKDNKVENVMVHCAGCAISVASGSMLAEIVKGKSLSEVKKIAGIVRALLKGEEIDENVDLGDLEALKGVKQFPVRIKCALLSWTTLVDAIDAREHGGNIKESTTE